MREDKLRRRIRYTLLLQSGLVQGRFVLASFPGPAQLSILQVTKSWAEPGSEASFNLYGAEDVTLVKNKKQTKNLQFFKLPNGAYTGLR